MSRYKDQDERLARPLLRWAGSKRQLVPVLRTLVPTKYNRYVEPFAGSAALFFALSPEQAVISDTNTELINFYGVFRRHAESIFELIENLPRTKSAYADIRSRQPSALSTFQRAVRFLYLNRLCFNGVQRVNRKGEFNVPLGSKIPALPDVDDVLEYATQLRYAKLECRDFAEVIATCGQGDFVYADPPYYGPRHRGEYGVRQFDNAALKRLVVAVRSASRRGAKIALSYSFSQELRRELPGWRERRVVVNRTVAGIVHSRDARRESLFTNFDCV